MNKLIPQFTVLLLAGWSINVWAFSCMDASGQTLHSMAGPGSVNVYVNLQPTIAVGQNLVVDISRSVVCRNDAGILYSGRWCRPPTTRPAIFSVIS